MEQTQEQSRYQKFLVDIKDFKVLQQLQSGGLGSAY